MKILMIAPEPYFQPRGTPFSISQRLRALVRLGHCVDLLTYRFGMDLPIEGVRHFRIGRVPWIRTISVGPSYPKMALDVVIFLRAMWMILRNHYGCIYTHEEACFLGAFVRWLVGIPHVYDMHSSLPQQLVNYDFIHNPLFLALAGRFERWVIAHSDVVIAVCPYLEALVRRIAPKSRVVLIENLSVADTTKPVPVERVAELRRELGLTGQTVILYTGTFEFNQGLDILLEAIPKVKKAEYRAKFVLVGGEPAQVEALRRKASALGVAGDVVFTGRRPPDEMPVYMEIGDILVSPRKVGTNTPLKIYSYMWSGKAIIASNLPTHTQVLTSSTALLVEPTPEGFSSGINRLLAEPALREKLGRRARSEAEQRTSPERYLEKTAGVMKCVERRLLQ